MRYTAGISARLGISKSNYALFAAKVNIVSRLTVFQGAFPMSRICGRPRQFRLVITSKSMCPNCMSSNVTRGEKMGTDFIGFTAADFSQCRIRAKKLNGNRGGLAACQSWQRAAAIR